DALQQARDLARRVRPAADRLRVRPTELDDEGLDQWLGGRKRRLHGVAPLATDERVRVIAGGEERAPAPQAGLQEDREAPRRGAASGGVAVEARDHVLAETAKQAKLVGGERRPERGDDVADPRLRERDHVE